MLHIKKSILLILFSLFWGSTLFAQIIIPKKDYIPEIRQSRYTFALSLISGAGDSHVSYGIMRENPDSTREVIFLTKQSFLRQVAGHETSRANPEKINFFEEYGIDSKILDELWKLKHDVNPYGKELGWGTELGAPSKGQYAMLKEFGIQRKSDYTFGDNLWRFLLKVSDPVWVGRYQNQP
jgi:hypothetical protein